MKSLCIVALAALVLPSAAHAQGCGGKKDETAAVAHIFDSADLDANGELTREEYEGAGLQDFGVSFEESDANSDGATTLDEYIELYERTHPSKDRTNA